jgi:hypothetical protein
MNGITKIVHVAGKGWKDSTYTETKYGNQIKNELTIQSNPMFEALVQHNP